MRTDDGDIIATATPQLTLRRARVEDVPQIRHFIVELATYEKLAHEAVATDEGLREHLFGTTPRAEVVFACWDSQPVGFALYFHNFSTFTGRPGIYLEDLYVRPDQRGRGIGRVLMAYLAQLAVTRNCARFEWAVLDWNEEAIRFYRSIGAVGMESWRVQRLAGEALVALASESKAR
jgi:GNAT superfamily N-acetyltransferase